MGDLDRLGEEKEYRDGLKDMENRIVSRMTAIIDEREARIIAAITGAAAAAGAAAPPPPPPAPVEKVTYVEEEEPYVAPSSPKSSKLGRAFRESGSKGKAAKEPEVIESTLADADKSKWVAIPGIKSTSGVQCESSCKEGYNRVRLDRYGIRWVIFEFDKSMEWIYPTKEGTGTDDFEADWEGFVNILPDKKACYALYNFEYMDAGGSGYAQAGHNVLKNKMVLFAWTDSKCKVRDRMVAASSQSAIKQVCKGSCDQPVHDKVDMKYADIAKELGCQIAS